MPKPQIEFTPTASFPSALLTPHNPHLSGHTTVRVLARDSATGDQTSVLTHPPGREWGAEEGVVHVYWEECLILRGRLWDKGLGKWFDAGHFCCRPPGMVHGPYWADPEEGCEEICWIRYPDKKAA